MRTLKKEFKRLKSFLKHLGVGFGAGVGFVIVGSLSVYFGVPETTALNVTSSHH